MKNEGVLHSIKSVFWGLIACAAVILLLSFLSAAVVYFSPMSEQPLLVIAVIIDILALLAAGFVAARVNGKKGLLMGLITAAIALLIMLPLGGSEINIAQKGVYCILSGMIGGIFGVK